jgi:RNA polymerase sigma-70 factor (ECF subfamily)
MLNLSRLSSEDSDYLTLSEVAQQGGTPACGGGGCAANTSGAPRAEESAGEQQQRKSRQTAVVDSIDDRWNRLMAAAQRGDDAAYERLMREVRVWLSRYFHRRLPADAADDATQEALLAIHVHKQSYQTSDPMRPWLKTIARFKWIDQLRRHVRSPDSLDDADVPVDDHGSAARAAVLLDMLLAETKPAQEIVIRLVKLRGESVEEASRISGQSPSLVKVNIHRGLKRIGRALDSGED